MSLSKIQHTHIYSRILKRRIYNCNAKHKLKVRTLQTAEVEFKILTIRDVPEVLKIGYKFEVVQSGTHYH
jgi:hypothetical protein